MKKNDWIIVGIVVIIATSVFIWNYIMEATTKGDELVAEVYFDGELFDSINVSEDKLIIVNTELGKNVIEVKAGKATMIEADCPDKICLYTGTIEKANRSIVCLPNKVYVQLKGNAEDEIDAIVQ
ncbi:MAG: hypothetical protein CVU84_07190 [Firmicutes bacterium HGW-Firmicutes-1]|jgi:hypothetical protein|nr:MAG: hypothetical protein CVU84_07190 [Firmicutes bacterium HGW-Firmicutes-1]